MPSDYAAVVPRPSKSAAFGGWFGWTLMPLRHSDDSKLEELYLNWFGDQKALTKGLPIVHRYRDGAMKIVRAHHTGESRVRGITIVLPMSAKGVRAFWNNDFDGRDISQEYLADSFATAHALYWWVSVAPGSALRALPLLRFALSQPPFDGKVTYAVAGSDAGMRILTHLGFEPMLDEGEPQAGTRFVSNFFATPERQRA
ncbi:hypothetical protein [Parvularcula marina]|nr:hypothetical protein [Parvularcula marina]